MHQGRKIQAMYDTITELRASGASWESISESYPEKSGEAWRSWYRRKTGSTTRLGKLVRTRVSERAAGGSWETNEWRPEDDYALSAQELREEFSVPGEFEPKRIRTTSGPNGVRWASAEWQRTTDQPPESIVKSLEALVDKIGRLAPPQRVSPVIPQGSKLFVPCLFDAHIGKLYANGEDLGSGYQAVAQRLVDTAIGRGFAFDGTLFVVGNDFGNADNFYGTTTMGTPQDNSGPWWTSVDVRVEAAISAVEAFLALGWVHVVMVPGNHDRYSNYWLGKVLDAFFANHPGVSIDSGPEPRKYFSWESTFFGFSHGNREKESEIPALMAVEGGVDFALAEHREFMFGHIHTNKRQFMMLGERNGVYLRWLPALTSADEWHTIEGYIGNRSAGIGLVYDKVDQLVDEFPVFLSSVSK